jgi:two-component system sensor histidine kinase/response regulator
MTIKNGSNALSADVLSGLKELETPEDPFFAAKLLALFIDSVPARLEKLAKAIESSDAKTLAFEAHSLKSSSLNIGANGVGAICLELEHLGKSGSVTGADKSFSQLQQAIVLVRHEIDAFPDVIKIRSEKK